jgi:hypothetical protein
MDRRLDRKLVALAAAYAVALNILLPVVAAVLPAAAVGGIGLAAAICSAGGAASDRGVPQNPQPLCPCGAACAMPGCAATALPGGAPIGTSAVLASIGPVELRPAGAATPTLWPGGSKLARGPPIG